MSIQLLAVALHILFDRTCPLRLFAVGRSDGATFGICQIYGRALPTSLFACEGSHKCCFGIFDIEFDPILSVIRNSRLAPYSKLRPKSRIILGKFLSITRICVYNTYVERDARYRFRIYL